MSSSADRPSSVPAGGPWFATTHWSVVLAARDSSRPGAQKALEQLCRSYWYPLYAYIRRRSYAPEDAQDLTQSFFAHLLERNALQRVAQEKGKFRSFLLASFNYFLADERDRAQAQKRGGGCEVISLDAQGAEQRYHLEPADERSPEKIFEHRWALTLLDQVLTRLRQEFSDVGKSELFEQVQPFLVEGTRTKSYAEAARQCGMSTEALKKAVGRMRRQYGRVFREEIARTVGSPAEVEEELRHLCAVLRS